MALQASSIPVQSGRTLAGSASGLSPVKWRARESTPLARSSTPKGGAPQQHVLDAVGTVRIQFPEVSDAAEARAAARKLLDEGVDGIKVYAFRPAPGCAF